MRIGKLVLLAPALAAMGFTASANAQDAQYAHAAIESGKLPQAERTLTRETRAGSREPEVLLNLAAVYAMTQRTDSARTLYSRVLAGPNASLIMSSNRVANAHDVARQGLRILDHLTSLHFASR